MSDGFPIDGPLDSVLLQLGVVCGLLTASSDGSVALDTGFLADPIGSLQQIPAAHAADLAALLTQLLGSATDQALGMPGASAGRQWMPLTYTDANGATQQTGCFVVVEQIAADQGPSSTVLGFGLMVERAIDGVTLAPYAYAPLIAVAGGAVSFVLDADNTGQPSALEFGFRVQAGTGAFGGANYAFDGFRLAIALPLDAGPQFTAVLINLARSGMATADLTVPIDAATTAIESWLDAALATVSGRISDATATNVIAALDAFLGGTGAVPAPGWSEIASGTIVSDWLFAIATTPGAPQAWLEALTCLCTGNPLPTQGTPAVSGAGTFANPYTAQIGVLAGATIDVSLAISAGQDGGVTLSPGLRLASPVATPVANQPVGAQLVTAITFATIPLRSTSSSPTLFPRFAFDALVVNPTGTPLVQCGPDIASLTVGSFQAGVVYTAAQGLSPSFALLDVSTTSGNWPSIDVTNFDADINLLQNAIEGAVQNELDTLAGKTDAGAVAAALAAVLGLAAPAGYTQQSWPPASGLITAGGLTQFIENPLTAFGAYWTLCLESESGQTPPFATLLSSFATLVGGDASASADGSGTELDPWQVTVHAASGGSTASLTAWTEPAAAAAQQRLHLGLSLQVPVPVSAVTASFVAALDLLDFTLPTAAGDGPADFTWLPGLGVDLVVTESDGLSLGPIAGITLGAQDLRAGFSWTRTHPPQWQAEVDGLSLTPVSGTPVVIGDLVLGNISTDQLQQDLSTLVQAALVAAGLGLVRNGGPFGLALTCGLGLLPDPPAIFTGDNAGVPIALPPDFTLPNEWPTLAVGDDPQAFLTNPWPAVAAQLQAVVGTGAEPLVRLVAWAVTGTLPPVGASGAGTAQSPWLLPLGIGNADASLWGVSDAPDTVGFGLQIPIASAAVAGVQAATSASLALGTITASGALIIAPMLSLVCEVAPIAADSYLVGNPAEQLFPAVAAIAVGIDIMPSGVAPHLVLMSAQASSASTSTDATLVSGPPPTFIAGGVSSGDLALLIGATMEVLSAAAPSNAVLTAGLDLLTLLDLAGRAAPPEPGPPAEYTIVPSAWSALLANPAGYLAATFMRVLADPSAGADLIQDIANLINATSLAVPPDLAAVPAVLGDLGLVQSTASGPLPVPAQWLALLADPLSFLAAQLQSLQASTAARRQLVTALGPLLPPGGTASLGPLTLTATPQGVLSLSLGAATTVASGVALGAAAGLTIDLVTPALDLDLVLAAPGAGIGLELEWNPVNDGVILSLVPAGSGPPALAPLQLMPTPAGYIASVAENALLSLLSTALGALITAEVLPSTPLVGNVLQALGLTVTGAGGQMTVIGLRPAFTDPIAWLLDPSRLGNGQGGFDLERIGSLLNALPGNGINGPDGSTLNPVASDGLVLAGLPFGGSVTVTATDAAGLAVAVSLTAPAVEGVSVTATAQATFAALAAPAISGSADATWSFADQQGSDQQDSFTASAGFTDAISLQTTVTLAGNDPVTVELLPFGGFNQLISGTASQLLPEIGQLLQTAWSSLNSSAAASPAAAPDLTTFIQAVIGTGTSLGITADTYMTVAQAIATAPLGWLQQKFTGTSGATNITSIAQLVAGDFAIAGVTVANNQVQFQAPLPDGVPGNLTLQFGPSSAGAALSLGAAVALQAGPLDVGLSAAVAVPLGQGDLDTTFGATLALDLDRATSGRLGLTPTIALTASLADAAPTTTLTVYPAATTTAPGTLSAQILPTPQLLGAASTEAWLMSALTGLVAPLIADTVLTSTAVTSFLTRPIGPTSITLGAILSAANIIETPSGAGAGGGIGYQLADIVAAFANDTPAEIATQLVATALSAFQPGTIIPLPNNNAIGLVKNVGATTTDYGVSLLLNGISLTAGPSGQLVLQVGDLFGADVADSWLAAASSGSPLTPGLALTLLRATNGSTPSYSFHFGLALGSVGFDYLAPAGQTLFDVEGVSARSLGLRLALAIDQDDVSDPTIGAAVRADGVAVPLGPSFAGSSQSSNPVAQSLLASGSSNSASGSGAVNPTFGVTLGYINQIYLVFRPDGDSTPGGASLIWLPVQRSFGPLQCQRIGLGSTSGPATFDAGFDGSISLAGLSVDLQGLTVGIPLTTPTDISTYGLSLQGLSVSFAGGPVSITGGLIETSAPVTYTGELQVATPALAITALGSFGTVGDDEPSLFAYVMVPLPLGGPPFFFVTGLAGGFGYNRGFVLPPVDQVADFPFVSWATNPSQAPTNGSSALALLDDVAPPEQGANWLAAGVRFTSFELLDSIALLVLQFGTHFQIDLVGTSTMTLPKGADTSYVHAELALEVVFDPTAGVLEAAAVLTPNSYVVDPACHLTGGFAFSSWFSGPHAGDFVLTLGGYYDLYDPPAWYPQPSGVPRLGISWSPGGGVSVSGGAYFALTPSCVMAGAAMQASYSDGNLSAWFSAYLDFLINWHPFYYEGDEIGRAHV